MHIAITIPYKPETAKGDVLSLMNFIDHEDNPFGSTSNFKSFDPAKTLTYFMCSSNIFTEIYLSFKPTLSILLH